MKPKMFFLVILLLFPASLAALDQTFLESATPVSPTLKGQGGVSASAAEGFDSLFANPAGFANPVPSITILDVEATGNVSLSGLSRILDGRNSWSGNLLSSTNPMLETITSLLNNSSLGGGGSIRTGWVGKNLGVGLVWNLSTSTRGNDLLSTKMILDQTTMGVVGMAWPFAVGMGTLNVGGALRPMQRTYATPGFTDVLNNKTDLNAYSFLSGFGLAWDLGLRWDYAGFRTGLTVKDVGSTKMSFRKFTGSEWVKGGSFPSGGSAVNTLYLVPTTFGLGTTWVPDVGSLSSVVQPTVSADLQIPVKDELSQPSFWTLLHVGGEVKFLKLVSVRAGFNQGYFTFGLGTRVAFVDLNAALYSDELGTYSGSLRRPAISLSLAFRL